MSNPVFLKYVSELRRIYSSLVEQEEGKADVTYLGGKDSQGQPHGHGKMKYSDGSSYEGYFQRGLRHGKGKFQFPANDLEGKVLYEGDWVNDSIEGIGELTRKQAKYSGEFKNGEANGKGVLKSASGERYEGDFKNGTFNGNGICLWPNGEKYEGIFKSGRRNGKGILYTSDGTSSEQEWKDDELWSGNGELTLQDGSKYTGEMKDGKPHGKGRNYYDNGKIHYDCEWKNGKKEGDGIEYEDDGSVRFEGVFRNNEYFHGKYYDPPQTAIGDLTTRGAVINGTEIYEGLEYGNDNYSWNIEVRNRKYISGRLTDEYGSYEGTIGGDSNSMPFELNGTSNGYQGWYGEIRNSKRNGYGRMDYYDSYEFEFAQLGKVVRIEGNFTDGKPDGACQVFFENGRQLNGRGDGYGRLEVYT